MSSRQPTHSQHGKFTRAVRLLALQRSSTNGRGLQVAPQVSRGLSLRQDHHHNRRSLKARITPSSSRIFSSMQFISIHSSFARAQSSSPASIKSGFPSLAGDAGFWPAGVVLPAGPFFSSIDASRMFVEPSGRLARATESPIAVRERLVGRFTKRERFFNHSDGSRLNMRASIGASQWKDRDSLGKDWQEQRNLSLPPAEVPAINKADSEFISRASWEGACRYAVQRSRKDDYEVADDIGISHSYMCKVLKGTAGLWGRRLVKFMQHTQCLAPLQWLADQMGCDVVPRSSQAAEIARLRSLLAQAERSAA